VTEVNDASVVNDSFPGNRKRSAPGKPPKKLKFGEHGELTAQTIEQLNLTPAERERAYEMLRAQHAYLQILDCLTYPVDPEGHTHDLNMLGPTKVAIAWTLALVGFRLTGPRLIKKRSFTAPGCYEDAHTWVDAREPDTAEAALRPEDRADDPNLPPDTRRLAAIRDGAAPMEMPATWHTTPKVTTSRIDREKP
jgi:hypothetical protein